MANLADYKPTPEELRNRHLGFLKRLDISERARLGMAAWLVQRGNTVTVPALKRAPSYAEHADYTDSGDLFVRFGKDHYATKIEVKGIGYDFTGAHDWPFRAKDEFFMAAKHTIDNAEEKPWAIYVVNPALTHVGIAYYKHSATWFTKEAIDHKRSREAGQGGWRSEVYVSRLEYIRFVRMWTNDRGVEPHTFDDVLSTGYRQLLPRPAAVA